MRENCIFGWELEGKLQNCQGKAHIIELFDRKMGKITCIFRGLYQFEPEK